MRGLADGTMTANASVVEHIDRCLGCMACVTACPSGVRYDLLIEQAREVVEEEYERPPGDWLLRKLVFGVFPYPRRLRVALALAPRPRCRCRVAACACIARSAVAVGRVSTRRDARRRRAARPGRLDDGLRAERRLR